MSKPNLFVALLAREILPLTIIVAVAVAMQRLTHIILIGTK